MDVAGNWRIDIQQWTAYEDGNAGNQAIGWHQWQDHPAAYDWSHLYA